MKSKVYRKSQLSTGQGVRLCYKCTDSQYEVIHNKLITGRTLKQLSRGRVNIRKINIFTRQSSPHEKQFHQNHILIYFFIICVPFIHAIIKSFKAATWFITCTEPYFIKTILTPLTLHYHVISDP